MIIIFIIQMFHTNLPVPSTYALTLLNEGQSSGGAMIEYVLISEIVWQEKL